MTDRPFFRCGRCKRGPVTGIYCKECRAAIQAEKQAAESENAEHKSERMAKLWQERRSEMLAAIKAGRAPAKEGGEA